MFGSYIPPFNLDEITLDLSKEKSEELRTKVKESPIVEWCPRCDFGNDHIISFAEKQCSQCGYPEMKKKE